MALSNATNGDANEENHTVCFNNKSPCSVANPKVTMLYLGSSEQIPTLRVTEKIEKAS